MKTNLIRSSLIIILMLFTDLLNGQSPVTIVFKGALADDQELAIKNESCAITAEIRNSQEQLFYQTEGQVITDDRGVFIFPLTDLPALFSTPTGMVELTLQITSNSSWLAEGKFSVKYHIQRIAANNLQITRFEGQKLNKEIFNPLEIYSDVYPLAYLKGVFLLSFTEELKDPDKILGIYLEMDHPEVENAPSPPADRGVKGGYAVGGYKTKK